jgi:hypothetical protein
MVEALKGSYLKERRRIRFPDLDVPFLNFNGAI